MTMEERLKVLGEVKVLASLREYPHPNVMSYRESFIDRQSLCIALEWSDNGTLQDVVSRSQQRKEQRLDEAEVWNYFLSVVVALQHVHSHGVMHRDVKLANIFLHQPGIAQQEEWKSRRSGCPTEGRCLTRVQLGDFGASTILDDRSRAMTVVGTPYYLSPELCMGRPYSTKSDVWAVGVVLYTLLNSRMPFEANNYAALILRIVQEEHAQHRVTGGYSPLLYRLCTWCMLKDESARPTARQVLSHPECLRRAVQLGLQLPPDVLDTSYRPTAPRALRSAGKPIRLAAKPRMKPPATQPVTRAVEGNSLDAERPLPVRKVVAPGRGVPLRKRRVQQGVVNATAVASALGYHEQLLQQQRPQTQKAEVRTKRTDISSVQQLPDYGDDDDDDDDRGGVSPKAHSRKPAGQWQGPRRMYSYESRPEFQDAMLRLERQRGGWDSGSEQRSAERYRAHVRSTCEAAATTERPQSSHETMALLSRHGLLPERLSCGRLETSEPPYVRTDVPPDASTTFSVAKHSHVSSMSEETHVGDDELDIDATYFQRREAPDTSKNDIDHYAEDFEDAEEIERENSDENEQQQQDSCASPPRVMWRVDADHGCSCVYEDLGEDDNLHTTGPCETFESSSQIDGQRLELAEKAEELVGPMVFAQLVEALTRDTPMSHGDLQQFMAQHLPSDATAAAEVMYLGFRYVMLQGTRALLNPQASPL
jgi:NIMA (never in mitosis gene a)-related kinase